MRNEYLFSSNEHLKEIEAYKLDGVVAEISTIKNGPLWVATFFVENKNEESAKMLSNVHTFIKQYSPVTLTCESSEYFTKALFPLINEFERKLRKLLYLTASISNNEDAQKTICNLEEKTLGNIFDLLFVDMNFVKSTKIRVNGSEEFKNKGVYSKSEIINYISGIKEDTLWRQLFDGDCVVTLESQFMEVFKYRNDVMHAHNIEKKIYGKARYLFDKINEELDFEIDKILGHDEDKPSEVKSDVNASISTALEEMNLSSYIDVFEKASSFTEGFKFFNNNYVLRNAMKKFDSTIDPKLIATLKNISSLQLSPEVIEFISQLQDRIRDVTYINQLERSNEDSESDDTDKDGVKIDRIK